MIFNTKKKNSDNASKDYQQESKSSIGDKLLSLNSSSGNKKLKDVNLNQQVQSQSNSSKNQKEKQRKALTKKVKYVQDTIPYSGVFDDGIIVNEYGEYSKTYPLYDVNFKIESEDVERNIMVDYQSLLNSFDSDVHIEISLVNLFLEKEKFHDMIFLKEAGEEPQDTYRRELNDMLASKEKIGDNEITKTRCLTVSFFADSVEEARQKFITIDANVAKILNKINKTDTKPMETVERLEMMYDFYNSGHESEFLMSYRDGEAKDDIRKFDIHRLEQYGLTTKDVIAPDYFEFARDKMMIGDKYAQGLCVKDYSTVMDTDFLVALNNVKCTMMTSVHCDIIDKEDAAKSVANLQTTINAEVIDAQKKAAKSGYSAELIPQRLQYESEAIQEYRDDIQKDNQRLFMTTIVIVHVADSLEQLALQEEQIKSIARSKMVSVITLREQQERALSSVMPLGHNEITVKKTLKTKELAILIPFELQEMTQKNGFYYGLNSESQRLILYNRKNGDNYNGLILGRSGYGKSFKAKEEIAWSYLGTNDDIIILDPQNEYSGFVKALGGEAINFAAGTGTYINPFDMTLDYADEDDDAEVHTNPLVLKNSYIASICEIAVGGRYGLSQGQKSLIDRVLMIIYEKFLNTGNPDDLPTMEDFYYEMSRQPEPEAVSIVKPLEQFAIGSLDLFAHKTNVVLTNRLTSYNIKGLTNPALKDMAMIACLNDIWNRVQDNHKKGKFTWVYLDEFHTFLKSDAVLDFLMFFWKTCRKFAGAPMGITQNISDLLKSQAAETIFANSSCIIMLNQAPNDRVALSRLLDISDTQQQYINNARRGSGLLWTGQVTIPFTDDFPTDTKLYALMSTNATESLSEALEKSRNKDRNEEEDKEYNEYMKHQEEISGVQNDTTIKHYLEENKEFENFESFDDHDDFITEYDDSEDFFHDVEINDDYENSGNSFDDFMDADGNDNRGVADNYDDGDDDGDNDGYNNFNPSDQRRQTSTVFAQDFRRPQPERKQDSYKPNDLPLSNSGSYADLYPDEQPAGEKPQDKRVAHDTQKKKQHPSSGSVTTDINTRQEHGAGQTNRQSSSAQNQQSHGQVQSQQHSKSHKHGNSKSHGQQKNVQQASNQNNGSQQNVRQTDKQQFEQTQSDINQKKHTAPIAEESEMFYPDEEPAYIPERQQRRMNGHDNYARSQNNNQSLQHRTQNDSGNDDYASDPPVDGESPIRRNQREQNSSSSKPEQYSESRHGNDYVDNNHEHTAKYAEDELYVNANQSRSSMHKSRDERFRQYDENIDLHRSEKAKHFARQNPISYDLSDDTVVDNTIKATTCIRKEGSVDTDDSNNDSTVINQNHFDGHQEADQADDYTGIDYQHGQQSRNQPDDSIQEHQNQHGPHSSPSYYDLDELMEQQNRRKKQNNY